jgi:hypothetical protein
MEWHDGQLSKCIIKAKHRFKAEVIYKEERKRISLEAGEEAVISL